MIKRAAASSTAMLMAGVEGVEAVEAIGSVERVERVEEERSRKLGVVLVVAGNAAAIWGSGGG
ncbi:hypothetical protein [Nonomuraea phyllanthi]|uniref:hypothetical protein n=1 Tax=Nonomuraea phyllanthi TaxID=2219224 RepID=UPI001D00B442|nr:hypothetical protein [Nonomuraea phyllanthi]